MASGMAQNPGHNHTRRSIPSQPFDSSSLQHSPRIRPGIKIDSPRLEPIPEPSSSKNTNKDPVAIRKATLRVDAFLGEWLSTDYFEQITPPPSSVMMVAGAKADLLRREDYAHLNHVREAAPSSGFPGGWGSPVMSPQNEFDDGPLPTAQALNPALRRDRTSSMSSVGSTTSRISGKTIIKMPTPHAAESGVYVPPIPHYAVSSSDPIPPGYVAHSKDACVDVDYQWDSMREPQNWGNGGEYGEEWSSMHKRFRRGLTQLVNWYRVNDDSIKRTSQPSTSHGASSTADDDEDTDFVVVLVTHGAGCNALIGAMTNQPVLLDVGMASLTMAVQKPPPFPTPASTPGVTPVHSRASSRTASLSDEYDVKLIASTEHLRRSSTASTSGSRTPSMSAMPYRPTIRYTANGATANPFVEPISIGEPVRSLPPSGNFGSIRRAASVASGGLGARAYTPSLRGSIGLWAPRRQDEDAVEEGGEGDDMVLNFGGEERGSGPVSPVAKGQEGVKVDVRPVERAGEEEADEVGPLGGRLWGSPRTAGEMGGRPEREAGPKRRWTVVESGMT